MQHTYSSWLTRWLPRPLAALALGLATAGAAHAQTPSFSPMAAYPTTGSRGYFVAAGDLNGDGTLDLVSANSFSGNVSVLLGRAAGGFSAAVTYAVPDSPEEITLVDVNRDGKLDAVLAATGSVVVLPGAGDGTLGKASVYSSGNSLINFNLKLYDVTRDGILDAVVSSISNTVSVLPGTASGTFDPATVYSVGSSLRGLSVDDFNHDGLADIAVSDANRNDLYVLLGQASGFVAPVAYATGRTNYDLTMADLNRDGQLDIIIGGNTTQSVGVLSGNANGTFNAIVSYPVNATSYLSGITTGDVNGDGYLDVVVNDALRAKTIVLPGSSTGALGAASTFSAGDFVFDVTLADINRDGKLDIVVANGGDASNSLGVLLNTTTYAVPTLTSLSPTSGPVGTSVTLTGTDLTGANAVSFNGTAATTFSIVNNTIMTTVPTGATSGPVTVTTPSGTSNGIQFTVLTNTPVVTTPANNSTTNGLPTFTGTAPVGSTVTIYLTMGGGAAQAIGTTTATGGNFSFTPATTLASGPYAAYTTAQSSGLAVSAQSNAVTFTVDATPPTATISTTSGSSTSSSPLPFTIAFSEAVTGLSASSFTVANGTVTSGPTSSGANAYSFSVTPTGNGVVSVSLPTNTVRDVAGNGNPVSNTVSVQYTASITATTWTGTISTDWFTAGNWTQGIPDATINATIPTAPSGGRFPAVAAGTASARNLTFNSGATLNQSGGTLAIAANLTNNGTFLPTGGTVSLGNTTLSNVLGSSNIRFWNLTVGANGAQLSTSIGAAVQRLLTLSGNFSTNGNSFVLESNTTLTALVVNNGSNVVNGTVTVQRAIDPTVNPGLGYRHYSTPVSNSTVGNLATKGFTPVVNPVYNTSAAPSAVMPFPAVFGYDDSRLSLTNNINIFDKGYFSPNAFSDPLAVGKGYTVNIAASELVAFRGTLNNGDLPLALTSTRNTYPDGGWQLLGNPYPAPLDYSRVAAADRIGLESAIYVYSSTSQYSGRYRVYVNGLGNPVVPVAQGFFARVASGQTTATMTFRNSQRLTAPSGTTLQRTTADPRPLVQLTLQAAGSPDVTDEFYAYAESGATPAFDSQFDAVKLPNTTGFNLAGVAATGESLAVDARATFTATTVLPLTVGVPAAGSYSLSTAALANLPAGLTAYLRDAQTGQTTPLTAGTSYTFSVSAVQAQALVLGRFAVVFSPQTALATTSSLSVEAVSVYPNPAHSSFAVTMPGVLGASAVQAELVNTLGQVVRRQSAALPASGVSFTVPTTELAAGVYVLRLQAGDNTLTRRVVVQ